MGFINRLFGDDEEERRRQSEIRPIRPRNEDRVENDDYMEDERMEEPESIEGNYDGYSEEVDTGEAMDEGSFDGEGDSGEGDGDGGEGGGD